MSENNTADLRPGNGAHRCRRHWGHDRDLFRGRPRAYAGVTARRWLWRIGLICLLPGIIAVINNDLVLRFFTSVPGPITADREAFIRMVFVTFAGHVCWAGAAGLRIAAFRPEGATISAGRVKPVVHMTPTGESAGLCPSCRRGDRIVRLLTAIVLPVGALYLFVTVIWVVTGTTFGGGA